MEFLASRNLRHIGIDYNNLIWPPKSVAFSFSKVCQFLQAFTETRDQLTRSRVMFVGTAGAGKTTLKTALLLTNRPSRTFSHLRKAMFERIASRWAKEDVEHWVDVDLANSAGFLKSQCPAAVGIDGRHFLEMSYKDIASVFAASKPIVKKIVGVLAFLTGKPPPVDEPSGWGWLVDEVVQALARSTAHSGVTDPCPMDEQPLPNKYAALVDLPHVWTEGIELEKWEEEDITLWDLPGQMELYPCHRLYSVINTAVYILVVKCRCHHSRTPAEECVQQLMRWVSLLRAGLSRGDQHVIPIRIVVTHTDHLTPADRSGVLTEVLDVAKRTFNRNFDFGHTCYCTVYSHPNGGDDITGVDALRAELRELKTRDMGGIELPDTYLSVRDHIMKKSAELHLWPVVPSSSIEGLEDRLIFGVMKDLGYILPCGDEQVILEPVTWFSRVLASVLHPFNGLGDRGGHVAAAPDVLGSHIPDTVAVHLTSVTACVDEIHRAMRMQGRRELFPATKREEVPKLLTLFDVCFPVNQEQTMYVFPALLPPVLAAPPWLCALSSDPMEARRYACARDEDTIPTTLSSMVMATLLQLPELQPRFFGRCTLVAKSADHNTFVGLHQPEKNELRKQAGVDTCIDVFAVGPHRKSFLGLVTLALARHKRKNYDNLEMSKISFSRNVDEPEFRHVLLGPCSVVANPSTPELPNLDAEIGLPHWLVEAYYTMLPQRRADGYAVRELMDFIFPPYMDPADAVGCLRGVELHQDVVSGPSTEHAASVVSPQQGLMGTPFPPYMGSAGAVGCRRGAQRDVHSNAVSDPSTEFVADTVSPQQKSPVPNEVLISYATELGVSSGASEGQRIMLEVAAAIEAAGLSVFHGKKVGPGENWKIQWFGRVPVAKVALVLLSPAYFESRSCIKELLAVIEEDGVTVIPVIVSEDTAKAMKTFVQQQTLEANAIKTLLKGNWFPEPGHTRGVIQGSTAAEFEDNCAALVARIRELL